MSCLQLDEVLWLKKRLATIINPSSDHPVPSCHLVLPAGPSVQVVQLQFKVPEHEYATAPVIVLST